MEAPPAPHPPRATSALSGEWRELLDDRLRTVSDLSTELPSLLSRLDQERRDLQSDLLLLCDHLSFAASRWLFRSDEARAILCQLQARPPSLLPVRFVNFLQIELPLLEKEVARIDKLRLYAETSLQFEGLVGDLEDAMLSIIGHASRNQFASGPSNMLTPSDLTWKYEKLLFAVKMMTDIENLSARILNNRLRWNHLLTAVDFRVDKALAALRMQALTDHRSLLASLGWPPSLSSKLEKNDIMEIPNPLVLMQGEKKDKYSHSFLLLCSLQHFQYKREARQHNDLRLKRNSFSGCIDLDMAHFVGNDLWTISELVNPMASRMELHFARWSDQPKFTFALVYKITRDFMDGIDNVLQPLIDKARLLGISAKEAWITAMVRVLLKYLEKEVFPIYYKSYYSNGNGIMEVISSWLHVVDLMTTFDKRMQDLAIMGTSNRVPVQLWEEFSRSLSIFSVFNDNSDWLQIWAEIELRDAEDKLKHELENGWQSCIRQECIEFEEKAEINLLSAVEDFKVPSIADRVVKIAWQIVERAGRLPSVQMRACFIRSSVVIFLNNFFDFLLQRYEDSKTELMEANIEESILLTLSGCINVARHIESVLREWSDDVNFLEMSMVEPNTERKTKESVLQCAPFFGEEIDFLVKLGTDSLVEIMSALLLQFDALCQEYIDDTEQWDKEESEEQELYMNEQNRSISPSLVEALDALHNILSSLKSILNSKDFFALWRSIADGIDYFIFRGILQNDVKFTTLGVYQLRINISALFRIFNSFCARPEAFFPLISDSLKLLSVDYKDVTFLLNDAPEGDGKREKLLQRKGLSHLTVSQAVEVSNRRRF